MTAESIPLLVIAGPTASGKTALAVELAKRFDGEVVSADSMQIYKGMDIGTAKPSKQEMQGIPHHMLGILPQDKDFSVADYVGLVHGIIKDIHSRGKLAILAGGTGLYISSLVDNIDFSPQPSSPGLRAELKKLGEEKGGQHLLDILSEFDPQSAERLHPNNMGRIIRAIEIYKLSGTTMSEQLRLSRSRPSPYNLCMLGLDFYNRQRLYDRIDNRVDVMLRLGLVEEARQVLSSPISKTAKQAIGYKEFLPFFEGSKSLEMCIECLKQDTRRYAKRQLTWFRRDDRFNWFFLDDILSLEELADKAEQKVRSVLFT